MQPEILETSSYYQEGWCMRVHPESWFHYHIQVVAAQTSQTMQHVGDRDGILVFSE